MNKSLNIRTDHLEIVKRILRKNLTPQAQVWVFGSRAVGTPKKYSDLDLAISLGYPLSLEMLANLKEDFDESDLPYKVDIVDWLTISDSFREKIQKTLVKII